MYVSGRIWKEQVPETESQTWKLLHAPEAIALLLRYVISCDVKVDDNTLTYTEKRLSDNGIFNFGKLQLTIAMTDKS